MTLITKLLFTAFVGVMSLELQQVYDLLDIHPFKNLFFQIARL